MKTICIIFCFVFANSGFAQDSIISRQILSYDTNTRYKPLLIENNNNEIIILGTSEKTDVNKTNLHLWRIDPNITVIENQSLETLSEEDKYLINATGVNAAFEPNTGDMIKMKMSLDGNVSRTTFSVTDKNKQTKSSDINFINKRSNLLLHNIKCFQDDSVILVGQENLKGILIRADLSGKILWEKTFEHEQTNILTNIACSNLNNGFYVSGISVAMAGTIAFSKPATICVLHYDYQGNLLDSDFFEGGMSPWPSSFPKIVTLSTGCILVAYDISGTTEKTGLCVRVYTKELKLLFEKQILLLEESSPPVGFDICSTSKGGFAFAGILNFSDLRIYECAIDGTVLHSLELNGEVIGNDIHIDYMSGKIFATYAYNADSNTNSNGIKLLSVMPYQKKE